MNVHKLIFTAAVAVVFAISIQGNVRAADTPAVPQPVAGAATLPATGAPVVGCATCGSAGGLAGGKSCPTCGSSWFRKHDKGPYVVNLCPGACFGYFQTQWRKWDDVCPYPYQGIGVSDAPKPVAPVLPGINKTTTPTIPSPRPVEGKTSDSKPMSSNTPSIPIPVYGSLSSSSGR
jgi:hypothetical protein